MKKTWKRLCTGFLALATVVTALPTTPVHAESKQYWTESAERVGIIEKVMNDGSIGSTFNEGYMKVEDETAYCIDINTDFKNGYKTRADASSRMSADQISDVALSLEYVKQYGEAHKEFNYKQVYLLEQCVVWQRLSVHLGWQCDNVRASYDEIPKATQDEVFSGAKAFVKENKGRYECGGYIYSGEGQELGQFWAKLNVGNAKLQKTSSNTSITDSNGNYSVAGATYGVFSDKDCTKQLMVEKYARENGISEYVNVLLAIIQVESGGTAEDVMQSSESLGLPPNSLDTENSIKQGCKYFASLLSSCKNQGIDDLNVAIQSYNYGGGYVGYVAGKGKKHTFNLAESFAREKSGGKKVTYTNPIAVAKNGGWRYGYGNMFYVEVVNQYLAVPQVSGELAQKVMNEALKYQGWKYVYGGSNPNTSFDCSGLTQWCYGKAGISLPRTAQAQYDATQHLPLSQAKAGDLVFFHSTYNAGSYVTHVGILVSPTQMYHAGDPIGYADLSSSYWQQHLIGAGRVKQ
ncbi:C40 family peptidase [Blautia obeum]|nr:C40 family peptidase [Blautia obeum]